MFHLALGQIWSHCTGIDLALALVAEDVGPEVMLGVARALIVFPRRPGGQSQLSGSQLPEGLKLGSHPSLGEVGRKSGIFVFCNSIPGV